MILITTYNVDWIVHELLTSPCISKRRQWGHPSPPLKHADVLNGWSQRETIVYSKKKLGSILLNLGKTEVLPVLPLTAPLLQILIENVFFRLISQCVWQSIGNWVLYKRSSDGDDSYWKLVIKFRKNYLCCNKYFKKVKFFLPPKT